MRPKQARRALSAVLLAGGVAATAGCTGTDLGGGLASAGFATPASTKSSVEASGAELSLASPAVNVGVVPTPSPIGDAAITGPMDATTDAAAADGQRPSSADEPGPTASVVAATNSAPEGPVPIASVPDASPTTYAKAPQVLALAPSKPKRTFAFAALAPKPQRTKRIQPRQLQVASASVQPTVEPESKERRRTIIRPRKAGGLPGVRSRSSLFQIGRAQENEGARSFRVASAAGLARLSTNGFRKQTAHVQTECFVPRLVNTLRYIEKHYGKPVTVTSGYRSAKGNRRAGGAKGSKHMSCEAADFQVEGVSKWELAKLLRSLPGRGGVGTYCHTASVHYDVGAERDWNWACRKRR